MTLDQLKVLTTIVEVGSFRAAAEKLRRAQSAVSYAIKSLEDEFGFELFDREKHRTALTHEGRRIYQRARQLVEESTDLERYCRHIAAGQDNEVRLSLCYLCPVRPIARVIGRFMQEYPSVNFSFSTLDHGSVVESVANGDTDVGISHERACQHELETYLWGAFEMIPVAQAQVVESGSHDTPNLLPQILLSHQLPKHLCDRIYGKQSPWKVAHLTAKKELIVEGVGWGYLPRHLVEKELDHGQLQCIPKLNSFPLEFYLIRSRQCEPGLIHQSLWQFLGGPAPSAAS